MASPACSISPSPVSTSVTGPTSRAGRLRTLIQNLPGPGLKRATVQQIWRALPPGWWVMPAAGCGLLMMLAMGQGLSLFVGKYAWTGKDFQEILGPSILGGAVAVALYLWHTERSACRAWIATLPMILLCRELHFAGTGTGVYIALGAFTIHGWRTRHSLQPVWNCKLLCCLWLGACSWYALAVTVDSGLWKSLPYSSWWSVNLEETLESGGHMAILLGILASTLMTERTARPRKRYAPTSPVGTRLAGSRAL